jgi:serine/threonine-protein kinase HipA
MFRLAAFNVAAVNDDDHLKNVAWLCDARGLWRVAPGFDLTYAPRPYGERWTTVAGAGRAVGRAHLLELALRVGLKPRLAEAVLDEVTTATSEVSRYLRAFDCEHPVSAAAAEAVRAATARVLRE